MYEAKKYYEHSGAVGVIGPMYMVVFGGVGALVLGAVYGYAIFYIPIIYFNVLITVGFGAGVGALVGVIGIGTMIAGYLYPNTGKELTNAVEEFEKK